MWFWIQEAALRIEDLLDKLSVCLTGEELEIIEKLYHRAMKLEVKFFSAQPILQQTIGPFSRPHDPAKQSLSIFCDFDMTCTAIDSSALLAEMAIRTAPKTDVNGCESQLSRMCSADLLSTWSVLSSQYTEEYEQCIESITGAEIGIMSNVYLIHVSLCDSYVKNYKVVFGLLEWFR